MIYSSGCEHLNKHLESYRCDCDCPTECDRHNFLWDLKAVNSPCTSDSVFYEENHFCSKIDDAPFKPCRSVHTVSENLAIEIRDETTISVDLPPLTWHGYNCVPKLLNVCQAGRNVLINGQWANGKPYIQGGPLNGSYIFSQIHFHAPSEHEIDGKRYPLEMHVVHYKTNYLTQERAMEEKDGTIVLVYFFQVKESCETVLSLLTKQSCQFKSAPRRAEISGFPLNQIVKPFNSHYYIYWGSINTSKKSYLLQWIINRSLLYATEQEVYNIFRLMEGGNSTGRRVPLMKPLNNAVYYVGGYTMALKQEEEETVQCDLNLIPKSSQSCQTFIITEGNKKNIHVQAASSKNCRSIIGKQIFKRSKGKAKKRNHESIPHCVTEEMNENCEELSPCENSTEALSDCRTYKNKSHNSINSCAGSCQCTSDNKTVQNKSECSGKSKESKTCENYVAVNSICSKCGDEALCNCKSRKKRKKSKEKRKAKIKKSKSSKIASSEESKECQTCKNQKCAITKDPSKCAINCTCHSKSQKKSKEKRKIKTKKSKTSKGASSEESKECQTCKNQDCTITKDPSKCAINCTCHSKSQKKSKEKRKVKTKKSRSFKKASSQELYENQLLDCRPDDEPVGNHKYYGEIQNKFLEKLKLRCKDSKDSEIISSEDFEDCQKCKYLQCLENCCCECHNKAKKKSLLTKKMKEEEEEDSTDSEENCNTKSKNKSKTKKTKDNECEVSTESPCSKSPLYNSKSSLTKNSSKSNCSSGQSSVQYVLTPSLVHKGSVPRVLYKDGRKEKDKDMNSKVCNFLVSEESSSVFASTYRLPQLKAKEPLKKFFIQTEHLFHTEKKGGFSMCTTQDYHVTIVYNQNVLQEFKGTFFPNKLQLGNYEKMDLVPVYPEPDSVKVHLEDCYVKMESLNKLYIRAKFLLRPSVLNLSSNQENESLNKNSRKFQSQSLLNKPSKINFVKMQEENLSNNETCNQSRSLEQFITPKTSLNYEKIKLSSYKKERKIEGYDIKLLKKPPSKIALSESNSIFTEELFGAEKEKESIQEAQKSDKPPEKSNFKNEDNLPVVINNTEVEKKMLEPLNTKNETKAPRKEDDSSLTNDSMYISVGTENDFIIKNELFKEFSEQHLSCETQTEEIETNTPLVKIKESNVSEEEKNTVVLFYHEKKNSESLTSKNKIKSIEYQDENALKSPDVTFPNVSDVNQIKALTFKTNLREPMPLDPVLKIRVKTPSTCSQPKISNNVRKLLGEKSTEKTALPSKIPILKKKRQQN